MIEIVVNDRLGKSAPRTQFRADEHLMLTDTALLFCLAGRRVRVKCEPDDTVGDLKKLIAAQTGTRPEKIRLQKWNIVYKDHITLEDYEIKDGSGLELFYN